MGRAAHKGSRCGASVAWVRTRDGEPEQSPFAGRCIRNARALLMIVRDVTSAPKSPWFGLHCSRF